MSEEGKYPSVQSAWTFILPSYQWMVARLEAVDGRIQNLVVFAGTITLGAPTLAKGLRPQIPLASPFLFVALILFVALVVLGIVMRARGELVVLSPAVLYEKWLHYSEWQFQKNALYWAGQHAKANATLINNKGRAVAVMTTLLLLEILALVLWMISV